MRKIMCFVIAIIVCFSILSACNSSGGEKGKSEGNDNKATTSSGEFKDQTNLKIGETAKVESTIGKYEITINSVKMKDEIGGEASQLDHFFVTEISLKNIGDQPIDALDTIGSLELTEDLKGSGYSDVSESVKISAPFSGEVKPDQTVTGEAVFEGLDSNENYIRISPGLIAAKGVKNKAIWKFEIAEAK